VNYLAVSAVLGSVAEILGGCLALAYAGVIAANYRGTADYRIDAHIAFRRRHERLNWLLGPHLRVQRDGHVEGADSTRRIMRVLETLFLLLFGGVLLAAGISTAVG
jgi:hypothetical protein